MSASAKSRGPSAAAAKAPASATAKKVPAPASAAGKKAAASRGASAASVKGGVGGAGSLLGISAARLVVARMNKSDAEEDKMVEKLEKSCRKFDHAGKGQSLPPDDYFNVIKCQHGIDIGKDEVRSILSHLPASKDGRIKISDFLHREIHSKEVFEALDRNKDGYITKGELKLAKKHFGMAEIDSAIKELDLDGDGKLNKKEFEASVVAGKKK